MNHSPLRRTLLHALWALPLLPSLARAQSALSSPLQQLLSSQIAALEASAGGRIGLALIDTADGSQLGYRADERFPFCSTGKVLAVAAILKRSMSQPALLQQRAQFSPQQVDASGYAPITAKHIGDGMTIAELCAAALSYSDNAAMNLLLDLLASTTQSGAQAVTVYARTIGDTTFRLDRTEPSLNTAIPDDPRDTSTPLAMSTTLKRLLLGDALAVAQRNLLQQWLKDNTTGDKRIRAGVPQGWQVGDKTGTGAYGTTNDLAILWPQSRAPIILAIYYTQVDPKAVARDEVVASATRITLRVFSASALMAHDQPAAS